jgi:hemerythrin
MKIKLLDVAKYKIGIEAWDNLNAELVKNFNHLFTLYNDSKPKEEILKGLEDLAKQTEKHFATELELLQQLNFPRCKGHKMVFNQNVKMFASLPEMWKAGEDVFGKILRTIEVRYDQHVENLKNDWKELSKS